MRSFALRVLVLVLALAQAAVAGLVHLVGPRIGEVLERHPAHVVPVSASLILGVPIVLLGVAHASLQLLPSRRDDAALDRIAAPTAVAFLAGTGWMLVFRRDLYVTGVLLALAVVGGLAVASARNQETPLRGAVTDRRAQRLVRAALGLHLGWASVGVISLAGHAAHAYGWNGFGLEHRFWAYLALVMGGFAVAGAVGALRGNLALTAAAIWAFTAIALGQWGADGRLLTAPAVGTAAMFAAVLVAISCVVAVANRRAERRLSARLRFVPPSTA